MDSNVFLPIAAGGALVVFMIWAGVRVRRRWLAWEAVLDHVARAFESAYSKGHYSVFGSGGGAVRGNVDGYSLSVGDETESVGSGDSRRERRYMFLKVSPSKSKPEYLGPPRKANKSGQVVDYSKSGGEAGELEIAGIKLESKGVDNKLRKKLADPQLQQLLAELFAADGYIEHGNVIIRSRKFVYDGAAVVERVRSLSTIAGKL